MILWALAACPDVPVEEWRCTGPLVELVTWRDHERTLGHAVARDVEEAHIAAAVSALAPRRSDCETTWRMGLWSNPDDAGLRVRDEALRRLLDLPPVEYGPAAWP